MIQKMHNLMFESAVGLLKGDGNRVHLSWLILFKVQLL